MKTHKCPACDYRRASFASVAMHYIRCHQTAIKDGYGKRVENRILAAKLKALDERFRKYRENHP